VQISGLPFPVNGAGNEVFLSISLRGRAMRFSQRPGSWGMELRGKRKRLKIKEGGEKGEENVKKKRKGKRNG